MLRKQFNLCIFVLPSAVIDIVLITCNLCNSSPLYDLISCLFESSCFIPTRWTMMLGKKIIIVTTSNTEILTSTESYFVWFASTLLHVWKILVDIKCFWDQLSDKGCLQWLFSAMIEVSGRDNSLLLELELK